MSKQLDAQVTCNGCGHVFTTKLYRSLWIENAANRQLVFKDEVNTVTCGRCRRRERLEMPLLCTNVKRGIAVWYEPYPDSDVDADIRRYAQHFGPKSFYATAPRVRDWEAFKKKILEHESRASDGAGLRISPEGIAAMHDFVESLKQNSPSGGGLWWAKQPRVVRLWLLGSALWALAVPLGTYMFEFYGSRMYGDDYRHMVFVMLVPPLFIGLAGYLVKKFG